MDANRRDRLMMDRSWMNYMNAGDRRNPDYVDGVNVFLDFAFSNAGNNEKVRCPCVNCFLGSFHDRKTIFYHLLARGILKDYSPWTQHGEDENEDESTPNEEHMPIAHEVHIPIAHEVHLPILDRANNFSDSHEEKIEDLDIHQGQKKNRDVHLQNDDDENEDSPAIPPNVWRYVNAIGISKPDAGGDVHQENDDNNGDHQEDNDDDDDDNDDDNGDQDPSLGEDDNLIAANHSNSSASSEDSDFVAIEAEHLTAEGDSPGHKYSARRRTPRGLKLKKEMEKNKTPVKVELPANLGRVVGTNARQFVVEGSWLLKQTLPPNVIKWKDLNPNDVAKLLEKVKKRFIFPKESHVDKALLWQFKQWFRHWRSDLRRSYFCKHETYEEQLADRPLYVKEVHWKWLVDYWRGEKFQKLSAINTKVRRNQKNLSCHGPTSIAQLSYELEKNKKSVQDSDQHPVYLKLFEKQKRRIDGTWINKEAEEGYDKLVKLHTKQLEKHGIDDLTPSEAYIKVFSRARSINLLGLGENSVVFASSSNRKRKSSDQKVMEAVARRVGNKKLLLEQKSVDREARNEESQSDPESEKLYLTQQQGGDVHQEDDDNNGDHREDNDDDDIGYQDPSLGEDVLFIGANHSNSSASGEDSDFVATDAEHLTAEGDSPGASQAAGNIYSALRRTPRGLKLKKEMEKNKKPVKVELPANLGRVVGTNARKFVVEGSWLLKQTLPPNVIKWKDLNPNDVAKLLEKVKKRFIFPKESHVDKALLWQFKQWFRHWRSDLRRSYFCKHETYEEQLADRPLYVKEVHWKWLVDYWRGEKFQKLSATNTKVRRNQKNLSCHGPTSIAQLSYELEKNEKSMEDSDQHPVYLKLFEKQKRRMDGTWINEEAEEGYEKLVKLHTKQLEKHGIDDLTPSEAYMKVFSKARSANLLGLGENPVALGSSSKRKRKSSDQKVVEATARGRVVNKKLLLEQKSADREARNEESQSDPESGKQVELHEQIRSIWDGLASCTNT